MYCCQIEQGLDARNAFPFPGQTNAMHPILNPQVTFRRARSAWQCEVERRPLVRLSLGPDAAAVALDDALHNREADASALEFLRVVHPLEHAEKLSAYCMSNPA